MMHADDMYILHPELQTAEEREDINYNPSHMPLASLLVQDPRWYWRCVGAVLTWLGSWTVLAWIGRRIGGWFGVGWGVQPHWPPTHYQRLADSMKYIALPDAEGRKMFEKRLPALGLSIADIDALSAEVQNKAFPPVLRRYLFRRIRSHMMRQLISCDNCHSVGSLCDVLRAEAASGIPAPVPAWYKYSTVVMGPRKIGYDGCNNRDCFRCETMNDMFSKCAQCRLPYYCSKTCQAEDWKWRHNKVCTEAATARQQTVRAGKMIEMLLAKGKGGRTDIRGNMNPRTAKQARKKDARR